MDSPSTYAAYVNTTTTSLGGLNLNLDPDQLEPSRTSCSDRNISLQQPSASNRQSFLKQDHEAEDLAEKLRKMIEENKKLTEKLSAMYEDFTIIKRFFKKYLMTMMMNDGSCNNNNSDGDNDDRQQQISTRENQNDEQHDSTTINLRKRKAAESTGSYLCRYSACHHDHHQDTQSSSRHRRRRLITSTSTDQGPNNYVCTWTRSSPRIVTINKPNVSKVYVRIRESDATLAVQDGYQWRKYGQKVTRDNPSPRAYFKCSFAPICPVKKKVQRSAEDPQMLIATYEGEHDHIIPPSLGSNVHILPPVTSTVSPYHHHGPSTAGILSSNPDPLTSGPAASTTSGIMNAHEHHPAYSVSTTIGTDNLDHLNQRIRTTLKEYRPANGQPLPSQRSLLVEQMAASLTSDPSFTAALAASISRTMLENSRAACL